MVLILGLSNLSIVSIVNILGGRNVSRAVDIAQNLALQARQNAMSHGSTIVLLMNPSSGNLSQSMVLIEGTPGTEGVVQWNTLTPFVQLPSDVTLAPFSASGQSSFYNYSQAGGQGQDENADAINIPSLPATVNGQNISNYSFIIFRSDGSVTAPVVGPAMTVTRRNKTTTNPDFMVVIQQDSGRVKVVSM